MASRVVLHIGPRKTATTYLQRALQVLVQSGQLDPSIYPIETRGRVDHNQVPGLIDLARQSGGIGLQGDAWTDQDGSSAEALLTAVGAAAGDVILSAEAMSVLTDDGAAAVVSAFDSAPVDVVVTTRDLARILPSSWQQHMRNGNYEAYADYLRLRAEERESGRHRDELRRGFWRAYRYGDLVRRWQAAGARSVSVVTVPASGGDPGRVWQRFVAATGVAGLPVEPPAVPEDKANISLTGPETFAIFGFNLAARAAGQGRRDVRATHRALIRRGWTDRPDRGDRLGLPADLRPEVARWAQEDLADLAKVGVPIFGDLADLEVAPAGPDGVPDAASVAAAAGAAAYLLSQRRGERSSSDEGSAGS